MVSHKALLVSGRERVILPFNLSICTKWNPGHKNNTRGLSHPFSPVLSPSSSLALQPFFTTFPEEEVGEWETIQALFVSV